VHVAVEPDVESFERGRDLLEDALGREVLEMRPALLRLEVGNTRPFGLEDLASQTRHVVAVVAVLGNLRVASQQLEEAGLHRRAESVHLSPGVVEVVLALDGPARGLQDAGERVPEGGVPRVADVEGAGRVGADELDLRAQPVRLRPPVGLAGPLDLPKDVGQPAGGQADVDEAGTRDLGRGRRSRPPAGAGR
jgi:hypothetical protein